ncbi:hypothetical protein B0T26DRAFT_649758 [Lasiosphaeria miniovina]|uniref:Uncharacterized protein n=1 Tax=Lasiosphaeria miniovina TaxID=1954250 RepID=A0AA40DUY9_9PEZI|nr:uncharacterized protein B0T26DRAFT_649758 [Lasiosphaeria miniovina]KAK0714141.1 hypothetical protein B0T26DRAFT_649758 [Lasiosphaeria miniovina]
MAPRLPTRVRTAGAKLIARTQEVGGSSILSLLASSAILTFVSLNTLAGHPDELDSRPAGFGLIRIFRLGSEISVQSWLAIVGAGFGMLSYGCSETYTHMFDLWCSRQASRYPGLNYARYLNSQPRAPVVVGFRGFPAFVLLRYFIMALAIPASIGYKFSISTVRITAYEHIGSSSVRLSTPPVQALLGNGTTSPWLSDRPGNINRAFVHHYYPRNQTNNNTMFSPPDSIAMVDLADCGGVFHDSDVGSLYTREIVMIAKINHEIGESVMTADHQGWTRIENVTTDQPANVSKLEMVFDYKIADTGSVQIQWAETGSWLINNSGPRPPIGRINYSAHLAVAVVKRLVDNRGCSSIEDQEQDSVQLLTEAIPMTAFGNNQSSQVKNNWLNEIILGDPNGAHMAISAIVRVSMAGWSSQLELGNSSRVQLGHAPRDHGPFNETEYNKSKFIIGPKETQHHYPVYLGLRGEIRMGSSSNAAMYFLILSFFSWLICFARLLLGPAKLTSWMGQHVYLALAGQIGKEGTEHLESGYRVARVAGNGDQGRFKWAGVVEKACEHVPDSFVFTNYAGYRGRFVNGL